MPVHVVTPPESEPVTLDEAKAHLRLEHTLDDTYVTALIQAAREHAEDFCARGVVTQTLELVLDSFPCGDSIELPKGNLQDVVSVTYVDGNGDTQTWPSTNYVANDVTQPGRLLLAYGASWPSTRQQWDAVKIRYTVGWDVADVPAAIKQACLLLISQMYEHRTPEVLGATPAPIKVAAVDALLSNYRLHWV